MICLIKCDKLVHKNICAMKLYFPSNELSFLEISMMKLEFYLESRKWLEKKEATKILYANLLLVVFCFQTDCDS